MNLIEKVKYASSIIFIISSIVACGGEGGESPTVEPSMTPNPTIDFGPGSTSAEAEDASLIGSAVILTDNNASGENFVSNLTNTGDGISLVAPHQAHSLILSYRAEEDGTFTIETGSGLSEKFELINTGGFFSYSALNMRIDEGDSVSIVLRTDDVNADLDVIAFYEYRRELTPWSETYTLASLDRPFGDGITVGSNGDVYFSGGTDSNDIIQISPDGETSTFFSNLSLPVGMDFDSLGNLYVSECQGDSIGRIDPEGNYSVFATISGCPAGLVVAPNDDLFVTSFSSNRLLRITPTGTVTELARNSGLSGPIGIDIDEAGDLYISNWNDGEVFRYNQLNGLESFFTGESNINQILYYESFLYIPYPGLNRVDRIWLNGPREVFASSHDEGDSIFNIELDAPNGMAIAPDGNSLYIGESGNGRVSVISREQM